jgi:hypothetical protein
VSRASFGGDCVAAVLEARALSLHGPAILTREEGCIFAAASCQIGAKDKDLWRRFVLGIHRWRSGGDRKAWKESSQAIALSGTLSHRDFPV